MASLVNLPAAADNRELVRALLFSIRIQHSLCIQPLRDSAIDRIVERELLLAANHKGLTIRDLFEQCARSLGGASGISHFDIRRSVDRLANGRRIEPVPVVAPHAFRLTEETERSLWRAQETAEALLSQVFKKLLRNNETYQRYKEAFSETIVLIFSKLGEAYVRYLRSDVRHDELTASPIVQNTLDVVVRKWGEGIREPLSGLISRFFESNDADFNLLKWNLGQNFYVAKALGLDSTGMLLTQEVFGNSALYLDTNVILIALEPNDPRHASFKALQRACEQFKISLFVSRISLQELAHVVDYYRELLPKVKDCIPESLAPRISDCFYHAYLRESAEHPEVDLNAIFARFESAKEILESEYSIKVVDSEWFDSEAESPNTLQLAAELRKAPRKRTKSNSASRHDALMMRWVDSVRTADKENVFFLTFDRSLSYVHDPEANQHPTCLTVDALLQWMGPNLTDDELNGDFASIYSRAIAQQLLPVDNFFTLEDFYMLAEMECECKQLPEADVIACVSHVKAVAPDLAGCGKTGETSYALMF